MFATCFGPLSGHNQGCQYKNNLKEDTMNESKAVKPQLATGKHRFNTTTSNYIVCPNFETGIKRMKVKNRPYSTTVIH
jgi:thermostable 8-oxoguanine DNA glycosylase